MLQRGAVWCSVLQCVAGDLGTQRSGVYVCHGVLRFVAVCCGVLQCVAVDLGVCVL